MAGFMGLHPDLNASRVHKDEVVGDRVSVAIHGSRFVGQAVTIVVQAITTLEAWKWGRSSGHTFYARTVSTALIDALWDANPQTFAHADRAWSVAEIFIG
jgi:hypothetical protein